MIEPFQWSLTKTVFAFITHFLIFIPGADLLKLTRDDVIQICGPADGIRLFNALKGRYVIRVKNISEVEFQMDLDSGTLHSTLSTAHCILSKHSF